MKVILKKDHDILGDEGQIVDVKDGYARNFLIPNRLAVQATSSNLRNYEEIRRQRRRKIEKQIEESRSLAEKIATALITVKVKAGEEGRIFGSVTSQMLHDALVETGLEGIDRKKINIKEPIKTLGDHVVEVKLQHSVVGLLKINVVSEDESESEVVSNQEAVDVPGETEEVTSE